MSTLRKYYKRIKSRLTHDDRYHERTQREEFFRRAFRALSYNGISGDYVEFGCHTGTTFSLAFRKSRQIDYQCKFWAFDSFAGLPQPQAGEDTHPAWRAGSMRTSVDRFREICRRDKIPPSEYTIVAGFYESTLTAGGAADLPHDIALAYIDCDLYSSTKTVITFLSSRLKHGMIVAFDDYYCWTRSAISGERRALLEFLAEDTRFTFLPYVQFGWHGMSFVVEDRRTVPPAAMLSLLTP